MFGGTSGKFLGFPVNERGIQANPDKIKALFDMEEPRCVKEVQCLNGRIIALERFISKSAEKSLPFFRALQKRKDFQWTEECSATFQQLKPYLDRPPLLSRPKRGEILFLYLVASDLAVAAVLIKE